MNSTLRTIFYTACNIAWLYTDMGGRYVHWAITYNKHVRKLQAVIGIDNLSTTWKRILTVQVVVA
jgi:hypothetical protein